MRVLFYSPEYAGHHFPYLARMMPGFTSLPIERLIATTPQALESKEFSKTLAPLAHALQLCPILTPGPQQALPNAVHRLNELKMAIRSLRPDHVLVCYADLIWEIAITQSMFGRRPWPADLPVEGWLYRGAFVELDQRWRSFGRRWLFPKLLRKGLFRKLHLDHELLYDFAMEKAPATPTEVVLSPNPILIGPLTSLADARAQLGIVPACKWISLSGMIMQYKAAPRLIEAFRELRQSSPNKDVRLLLAGPHDDYVRAMLRESDFQRWVSEGSIVSIDRYVDEREMYLAAAASDLVVAPYSHHGRSSIILWAAAAGRPSLGSDTGCVGRVIKSNRLGWTCDVSSTPILAKAITTALEASWTDDDVARVRDYADFHRVENYQKSASALVRASLQQSAPAA